MITYAKGSIFDSQAKILVNPVNTVGVMGKGLALQFKQRWPTMFKCYKLACDMGVLEIGDLYAYKGEQGPVILCFPTKKHWRDPSKVEYIEAGLRYFTETYPLSRLGSIAFPMLGCGEGGLDFDSQVRPLMEQYLNDVPIEVYVYI